MTPEARNVEWKGSWRDEYLAWICGFANAQGGVLEIGRNDRGEVVGVKGVLGLLEDIPSKVRSLLGIVVDVNLKSEDGLEYIRIVVEPHPNPISYRGRFHYRSGSTKQVLEGAALTRLLLEKHGRTWDDVPLPGVALGDLETRAFTEFRRRGVEADRLPRSILQESDASVIDRLQLREGAYLKRAAVLLFHPAPNRLVSEAYVKIGYFRGTEILYQDIVQGDLFSQIDRAMAAGRHPARAVSVLRGLPGGRPEGPGGRIDRHGHYPGIARHCPERRRGHRRDYRQGYARDYT